MTEKRQTPEERRELMERHKDHDEREFGVRPDIVLDATEEDADWIRNPAHWRKPGDDAEE